MNTITKYVLAAVVMSLLGGVCVAAGLMDREIARAQQDLAALSVESPDLAADRMDVERYLDYASRVPWIGTKPLNDVRARNAAMRYWQQQYGGLVPAQSDPMSGIAPDNVDLQLVVANAVYRTGRAQATNRQATREAITAGINAYRVVLENSTRNEDAAFNFEYLVRLREEIDRSRRGPGQTPAASAGGEASDHSPHGRRGLVPPPADTREFKSHVPLAPEEQERERSQEAGVGSARRRKG